MLAIIGTAGRDKTAPMTRTLWESMCTDLALRLDPDETLVSGGAAWADHLAVWAFNNKLVSGLVLHLPAPINTNNLQFEGGYGTSGGTCNYYHNRFSNAVGFNSIQEIVKASYKDNCTGDVQPVANGYQAMFTRNNLIASKATGIIAYTWGDQVSGGTKHTWDSCLCPDYNKTHVNLHALKY